MNLGTILVSAAIAVVSAAFVAKPFRRDRADVDRLIDAWVRQARPGDSGLDEVEERHAEPFPQEGSILLEAVPVEPEAVSAAHVAPAGADEATNFCPYCGRSVEPDHIFCPKCGRQLAKGGRS